MDLNLEPPDYDPDDVPTELWAIGPSQQEPRASTTMAANKAHSFQTNDLVSRMPKQVANVVPQALTQHVIRDPEHDQIALLRSHNFDLSDTLHECSVCRDRKPAKMFHALMGCDHAPYCISCTSEHFRYLIEIKATKTRKCLNKECKTKASMSDLLRVLPPQLYEQYDRILMKTALEKLADFRFCTNPACGSGALGNPDTPILTCMACNWKSCFTCKSAWHAGFTCAGYQQWLAAQSANDASAKVMEAVKRCPSCAIPFDKEEGCIHMKCNCGAEFCFHCLGFYTRTKERGLTSAHRKDCFVNSRDT